MSQFRISPGATSRRGCGQRPIRAIIEGGPAGRRPALDDGPDVWEVARVVRAIEARGGRVIEEAAALTGCTPAQIDAVARYYADYRQEVDDWIRRVDEEAARLLEELEDRLDLEEARAALAEAQAEATVPWEVIKAELRL